METNEARVEVTSSSGTDKTTVVTKKKYIGRVLETFHFSSTKNHGNGDADDISDVRETSHMPNTNDSINDNNNNVNNHHPVDNIPIKQRVQFPIYNNLRSVVKERRLKQIEKKHKVIDKKEISTQQKSKNNLVLKRSRSYEVQNQIIFIITWFCLLPVYYIIFIIVHATRYWLGHFKSTNNETLFLMSRPAMKMVVSIVVGFILLSLVAHRLAAFLVGFLLRVSLRKSLFHNTGQFDIHFGWISYRGFLDLNQLVIHDLMWRNPPAFQRTPFLLHCKVLTISFDIKHILYDLIFCSIFSSNHSIKAIKFDEINIDSLEIYFERGNTVLTENSLNAWAAVGAENKISEKTIFQTIVKGIWQAIVNRTKKNYMFNLRNKSSNGNSSSPWQRRQQQSGGNNNDNDNSIQRHTSRIRSFVRGRSSRNSNHDASKNMSVLNNADVNNVSSYNDDDGDDDEDDQDDINAHAPTDDNNAINGDNDDNDKEEEEDISLLHEDDLEGLGLSSKSNHAAIVTTATTNLAPTSSIPTSKIVTAKLSSLSPSSSSPAVKPVVAPLLLPTVELNRLLIFNLLAHPLDLLSVSHIKRYEIDSRKSTIQIKLFHLTRYDITKPKPRTMAVGTILKTTLRTKSAGGNNDNNDTQHNDILNGSQNEEHDNDTDDNNDDHQRIALPADEFGDRFGDAFAAVLVSQNPRSILITLIASIVSKMMSAAASTSNGVTTAAAAVANDVHFINRFSNTQLTTTKVVAAAVNATSAATKTSSTATGK